MSSGLLTGLAVDPDRFDPEKVGPFRYGVVEGKVLITNDAGHFHFFTPGDFDRFLAGALETAEPLHEELAGKGFLKGFIDADALAARIRRKKAFLGSGPHLHVVVATLRCNHSCRYCHASRTDMDRVDTDMSLETAREVVDFAMRTPAPVVNFEFQGGEPTVNFPIVRFVTDYALEKRRYDNRELLLSLVSNLTYMDDEKADFLVDRGVMVCTSLDGPADLHDQNRGWMGKGSSHATVIGWMDALNQRYIARGLDPDLFHVDALMTTTRATLSRPREVVDSYVDRGLRSIHLRPLNPFGFATATWKQIGYSMEEFLAFYVEAFSYILELNRQGVFVQERMAAMFLTKMLTPDDPNYTDCRSPAGSGSAQLAYNYDGTIYTCDEGRMLAHMGSDFFRLGHVRSSAWDEVVSHPTVKALAVASIQDALPGCVDCVFAPTCGIQPIHNFMFDGDLFGQRPNSRKCAEFLGVQRYLYGLLANDEDGSIERIFRRWTIQRSRPGTIPYALASEDVA